MNAVQQKIAIDSIIDRVKSARFADYQYYLAINQAIMIMLDGRTESIDKPKNYSFESSEMLVRQLFTLVKTPPITGVPVGNNFIPLPPDLYYTTLIEVTVTNNFTGETVTNACFYLPYGEKGIIQRNPFKKARIYKTYYTETGNGWTLTLPDNCTCTSYTLNYLKNPATVTIGQEDDKINAGGTLVVGQDYYVYPSENANNAVSGGITYYDGNLFTATNALLTSGTVIPASVVVNCDMPQTVHEELNRLSSAILMDSLENYLREGSLVNQNEQS